MGFEADLRAYLEQLEVGARLGRAPAPRIIDEHALHAYVVRRLGELEAASGELVAEMRFRAWVKRVAGFARHIASLPPAVAPTDSADAQAFAERALEVAMGLYPAAPRGRVEQLELERIVEEFIDGGELVARYAVETSLARDEPGGHRRLTPLGTALLRLRGKDAIRWLLTCEVLQNTGRWDPWRTPRVLLEWLLADRPIAADRDGSGSPVMPFDESLLARLADLGVVGALEDDRGEVYEYYPLTALHDAIQAVLGSSSWHHAIRAVLAEDRTGLVESAPSATESAVEQVKLFAHEVRNALVPARIRLDALRAAVPESQFGRVDAAKRGVVRVLTFVEELVETSELVTEPTVLCDLAAVVREAIGWLDDGERVAAAAMEVIRVTVPRTQLMRAILNVLRNALQATPDAGAVCVGVQRRANAARIAVDDSGPGVPSEMRERVFHDGFTTRTHGSGYGLAYVQRVVVDGLRGRVWCEASDLGGARFVIELPEAGVDS